MEKEEIIRILELQKKMVKKKGYDVVGMLLYGSQNYHMDGPASDVDSYAVILPAKESLVFEEPVSMHLSTPWGDVNIKDVRLYLRQLLKSYYSTVETLITPYRLVDERMEPVFSFTEEILNYNIPRMLESAMGTTKGMLLRADKTLEEKTRFKELARVKHLHHFVESVLEKKGEWISKEAFSQMIGCSGSIEEMQKFKELKENSLHLNEEQQNALFSETIRADKRLYERFLKARILYLFSMSSEEQEALRNRLADAASSMIVF